MHTQLAFDLVEDKIRDAEPASLVYDQDLVRAGCREGGRG